MPAGAPERRCASCFAPLDADQRYCLECGARAVERGGGLAGLMRGAAEGWPARGTVTGAGAGAAPAGAEPLTAAGDSSQPRMPSRKLAAGAVAGFLGFGVLIGLAAGSRVDYTLAAGAGAPLRVVMPPSPSGQSAGEGSAGPSEASEGGSEAPSAEPEPTPTAAAGTPAAGTPSSSSTAAGSEGEGEGGSPGSSSPESSATPATKLPPIKHVFVISLSDEAYATVFGPSSSAHFLTGTLEPRGELLVRYDAVAHEQLANEVALISGQGPTTDTAANCPTYTDISPTGSAASEQVLGGGCVYPASTQTLAAQLSAKHLTWRAYVQGIDEAGATAPACAHPAPGQVDPSSTAPGTSGPYATFRNPFAYFHGIVDSPACASDVVGVAALKSDLATVEAHAELLLHRARPLPRRQREPLLAGSARGARPGRRLPLAGGADDHGLQGVCAGRPARDHRR